MNIDLVEYKNDITTLVFNQLIEESSFSSGNEELNADDVEYFDLDIYNCLKTPQERIRYFILYNIANKEILCNIITNIINDLEMIFINDVDLFLKTLLKLFGYNNYFIPVNDKIPKILYKSLQNEDFTNDSLKVNLLYICKYGLIYSEEELFHLYEFSIKNDSICRSNIFHLILYLLLFHNIIIPFEYINELIDKFWDLKTIEKYLFTRIILSMILSKSEINKLTIQKFFSERAKEVKEILMICSDGENIPIIATIVFMIQNYDNYEYFLDIVQLCIEKKKNQNLQVHIPQEDEA